MVVDAFRFPLGNARGTKVMVPLSSKSRHKRGSRPPPTLLDHVCATTRASKERRCCSHEPLLTPSPKTSAKETPDTKNSIAVIPLYTSFPLSLSLSPSAAVVHILHTENEVTPKPCHSICIPQSSTSTSVRYSLITTVKPGAFSQEAAQSLITNGILLGMLPRPGTWRDRFRLPACHARCSSFSWPGSPPACHEHGQSRTRSRMGSLRRM